MEIAFGGHVLRCRRSATGLWSFACPTMPDLADRHYGATDPAAAIAEFERRARGGPAIVRRPYAPPGAQPLVDYPD